MITSYSRNSPQASSALNPGAKYSQPFCTFVFYLREYSFNRAVSGFVHDVIFAICFQTKISSV